MLSPRKTNRAAMPLLDVLATTCGLGECAAAGVSPADLPRNLEITFQNGPPRRRLRRKSTGPQVAAGTSSSGMAVLLVLRGLNIQYPFSQLILAKLKDTEVRDYALGHRNIANPDEEMFLIETPPKNQASAAVDHIDLGPPPRRAQIVGTVSFSKSEKYKTKAAWNGDRRRHCIGRGSLLDWQGGKGERHAWRIGQVRCFLDPVPVSDHTQTGYPTRRQLTVSVAGLEAWDVRSRVGASEVVGNGGHGMHIQQPGAAMYIYISICISICV